MYVSSAVSAPFLEAMATASVETMWVADSAMAEKRTCDKSVSNHLSSNNLSKDLSQSTVYLNFDPVVILLSMCMPFIMVSISVVISKLVAQAN